MAKAGAVVSGISSVVGIVAASQVAGSLLAAAEVATLSAGAATALGFGIPIAGALLGIMLADTFFGKGEEKRGMASYAFSAICSLVGMSLGGALLGGTAFAASAGSLATEEAIKQTVETGIVAPSINTLAAITSVGSLIGGSLGSILGIAMVDKFSKSRT